MKIKHKNRSFTVLSVIAWRNIWRNGRRTALCIVAVGIAVFFIIFMQTWINGMVRGMEEIVQTFDSGHVSVVSQKFNEEREYFPVQYPVSDGMNTKELVRKLESIEGVKAALPRVTAYASLFDSMLKHAILWGIDIEKEMSVNDFNLTEKSNGLVEGRFPDPGKNECAIGTLMAEKANLKIGDSIPLKSVSANFSDKYWSPVITGIYKFDYTRFDEETILVPIDRLQRLLDLDGGTQQLVIFGENAEDSPVLQKKVEAIIGSGSHVTEWSDNYWVAMMRSMSGMYVIIFGVFQIVASFLIINTMLMIIHERIKEIGMMGALGMTRFEIVAVFFFEALFLSILGAAAGALVGGIASYIGSLFPLDMNAFTGGGMKDFPISGTLYLDFSIPTIVQGFMFGVIVSGLCTLLPSMRSAFIKPVEALRR